MEQISVLKYQTGFANHFATEAIPNTLPKGQNSPQKLKHDLYAEQLSGSAFTAPKGQNFRSWLYRIQPSVVHGQYQMQEHASIDAELCELSKLAPQQLRWGPFPLAKTATSFIDGWYKFASNADIAGQIGATTFLYTCNKSMDKEYFYSADGELLIVPEQGRLQFKTEMGLLDVGPEEIIVIPRGIKFQVNLLEESARGYI